MYLSEIEFELRVKETDLWTFEYLGNKVTSFFQDFHCYVESSYKKLRLNVLIHVVKTCDIGCTVTNHQITKMPLKWIKNLSESLAFCYIANNVMDVINGCCLLQIDWYNSFSIFFFIDLLEQSFFPKLSSADLTPATRCSAEINYSVGILEDVVDVIDLE